MIGYSRAVVDGEWIFVSGTSGFDYETMSISNDVLEQTEQRFINIISALKQADSTLNDIVRAMYILPNSEDFEKCWQILRKYLGEIRPIATMISANFADKRMKIEIQVTAKRIK